MIALAAVLMVASAVFAAGAMAVCYRRDAFGILSGLPVMAAGAALAMVGVSRLGASIHDPVAGQAMAILISIGALVVVAFGIGLAVREGSH